MSRIQQESNNNFLSRINKILGKRKKHPWGRAIGLKTNRITDIFLGKIPSPDALIRIHTADKVSLTWLLTGVGAPYSYMAGCNQSDEINTEILKDLLSEGEWVPFVIYHQGDQGVSLAITRPRTIQYDDATASFIDVEMMQAGPMVLEALPSRQATWLYCDNETYADLVSGEIGPEDIESERFEKRGTLDISDLIEILKQPENTTLVNLDENKLVSYYRNLTSDQRQAIQHLLRTMDTAIDVFQAPPITKGLKRKTD